ncbi:MAG: hypothetical protein QNI89_09390, partial [Desulfobacterales bacterium]|nr:hypothetical protein [Desulfobacterales bacterium]
AYQSVGGSGFSPLSRAEHRRGGREKRADLSERSEFPRAPHEKAGDEASFMLSGKAQREVRRAAIVRL